MANDSAKAFLDSSSRSTSFLSASSSKLVNTSVSILNEQSESLVRHLIEKVTSNEIDLKLERANEFLSLYLKFTKLDFSEKSQIIMHPAYHYWLRAMRRVVSNLDKNKIEKFVSDFPSLIWIEVLNKRDTVVELKLDSYGGLRCLRFCRFLEFGQKYASQKCWVSCQGGVFIFQFEDGLRVEVPSEDVRGIVDEPLPTIEENGYIVNKLYHVDELFTISSRDEYLRVRFTGTNQRKDGVDFFDVVNRDYDTALHSKKITRCLNFLKTVWLEQYKDLANFTKVAVPRNSGPNNTIAFTISSRQGAIFLDDMDEIEMAESIIHENAHVKLRYLQLIDSILENFNDDDAKYKVSWRPDPRPLPGILEGVYVFSHVAEFYIRLNEKRQNIEYLKRAGQILADVGVAISILDENGRFTELGGRFFDEIKNWRSNMMASLDDLKISA